MKAGLGVNELATQVTELAKARKDYIVNSDHIHYQADTAGKVSIAIQQPKQSGSDIELLPTQLMLDQIGARLEIPRKYFKRMQSDAPDLLVRNLEHWSHRNPERRMVRTFAGRADNGWDVGRAYLSDRYKRLENEQVLAQIVPQLAQVGGISIQDCQITENRMYVKAVTPKVQGEIKKGDAVQAGVIISNSEVGGGALNISPLVFRLVCLNGMILPDKRFRAFHVGRRAEESESVYEMLTDETRQADDHAILLKARDVANSIFNQDYFDKLLLPLREAAEDELETKRPDKAVEVLSRQIGMNEEEQMSVLTHLISGGDLSRWGMANAVTRAAQDVASYDRSVHLETVGGNIIHLDRDEWKDISKAE